MEKGMNKEDYERITSRIGYYMKSNNIARIFKEKCPLFAEGGRVIHLFNNSLEHMGYFCGDKESMNIQCLCTISNIILASGTGESTIKLWDIKDRSIKSTLYEHIERVSVLCSVKEGVFVSGSFDKSLIIWSKSTEDSYTYLPRERLRGHTSFIKGIIRLSDTKIISGEEKGDLMIWNIAIAVQGECVCIRHISNETVYDLLYQMKQHIRGHVVVSYEDIVKVWDGAANEGTTPIKQFNASNGHSIEFLSPNLLLRGGLWGQLEFIDYALIGCPLPPAINDLHSQRIYAIQRIAKNIVVSASADGYLKVINPISKICYLRFMVRNVEIPIEEGEWYADGPFKDPESLHALPILY